MNADIKQKWVAALRSGEYVQGKGVLRSDKDQFCCLGVLCDLAEKEGVVTRSRNAFDSWTYEGREHRSDTLPPHEVVEWAGLPDFDPRIEAKKSEKLTPTLSTLNDGWPVVDILAHSFEEIADIIEAHL